MEDSIFTKIIKGDIPAHKIYEDDFVLAFLDIHPITKGHTLVIPKKQVEFVWDLEDADYQALFSVVQKIAIQLRSTLGAPFVSEKIVGTDVPHAHVHLIPFTETKDLHRQPDETVDPDHAALAKLAASLKLTTS